MEKHWAKNISLQLYTSDLLETQRFYSVVLGIDCDGLSQTHVVFSFNSTVFIFTTNPKFVSNYPYYINFEVYELDKVWESIRLKVDIIIPITDTADGIFREFIIHDNNGYCLRFFEKNQSNQLSLNFYDSTISDSLVELK
jgi:predicted enzyme related to lactoylglutathione lyase